MDDLQWIRDCNLPNEKKLEEEYIQYYKDNVMINSNENDGPYDGYYGIPNWKEAISLRNRVLDTSGDMYRHLMSINMYEQSVEQLRVITYEEYTYEYYGIK